jgi:lipoprotein signal peptidase
MFWYLLFQTSDNMSRYSLFEIYALLFQTSDNVYTVTHYRWFEIINTGKHYRWFERAKHIFEIMNTGTHFHWLERTKNIFEIMKTFIISDICLALSNQR